MTNTQVQARSDTAVLQRLWHYLRQERPLLLGVFFMLILVSIGQALAPALIGRAVDEFIVIKDRAGLARTMWQLLAVYALNYIGFMGQIRLMGIVSQRFLKSLRSDIFSHVQRLSLGFFYKEGSGDLMSRLVNDTDVIGTLFSQSLVQSLGSIFSLVGIIIAMISLNLPMALVTLLVLPIMFADTIYFSRRTRAAYRRTRETLGHLSEELEEDLSNVRESQAFVRTALNIEHFRKDNAANRDAHIRAAGITSAFAPTMDVLSTLATAAVAGVGGWLVFRDAITVGVVVAYLSYVERFFRPVQQISNLYTQMQAAFAASERVFDLLDTPPAITNQPDAQPLPLLNGNIHFEDVFFGYEADHLILKGLTLIAEPGQTVALVGETGAGKSTVINLIGRFYDVNQGRILVDGYDVRQVTMQSLRGQMGEVPQDSFLFSGTIIDNIRYGRPQASLEEVTAAAQAARAHDFITDLSDGYNTHVAERGSNLSQGQRQLLCIARAILANPRLLILDEATSNIDTRTEQLVQQALDVLLKGRTAFVIAHRLSTIRQADKIIVLGNGNILEQGTHQQLLDQNGVYANLYRKQIQAQK